ncbi:TQO small subunit DoxD [Salinigranum marinum]|uniref:TQO small subunit DoxD n=1 Tax=Salinigranum marinum TaxID=1515595 RepID=UPI002989ED9A|nr:TQO small subunit DoxD [Salinigranum marinum]
MTTNSVEWFGKPIEFAYAESTTGYLTVLLRLVTGYWFLHAGVTKFAFVAGEPFNAAGWLANATAASPIHGFLVFVAETPWLLGFTNFAIPVGEALIGLALIVGAFTRFAAFWGAFLMVFFYLGNADWAHGYVNGDLFGLLMFVIIGTLAAGRILGVDTVLEQTETVRQRPALKYFLG